MQIKLSDLQFLHIFSLLDMLFLRICRYSMGKSIIKVLKTVKKYKLC